MTNTENYAAFRVEVRDLFEQAGIEGWSAGKWLTAAKGAAHKHGIVDDRDEPEVDFFELWRKLKDGYVVRMEIETR